MVKPHSYRSREELYAAILSAIKEYEPRGGIRMTRLLMKSNHPHNQLKHRLEELWENGLIVIDQSNDKEIIWKDKRLSKGNIYHLTEKGETYLEMLNELKMQMGPGVHI